jgi:GxxExxY protein
MILYQKDSIMPIHTSIPITIFHQEAFHSVDKVVTGVAFDIHNEFGRYLEERLYQREFASRLSGRGLVVHREMQMTLTLDDFSRDYFADFLVSNGVIVETKAVEALTNAHKAQTLRAIQWINFSGQTISFHTIHP